MWKLDLLSELLSDFPGDFSYWNLMPYVYVWGVGLIFPKSVFNHILDFSATANTGCLQAEGID